MMRCALRLVAGAVVLLVGEAVRAADFPVAPPIMPVREFVSNWYVRGDAGYGFLHASNGSNIALPNGTIPFSSNRIDNAATFGVGFGYKLDWFRADVTVDTGTKAKFLGYTPGFTPDVSAQIWNLTTLFNAYVDLGTWYGFTPYVGAGVGFSYFTVTGISDASVVAAGGWVGGANSTSYDLAWAGNAGIAYNISRNFLVDLSYRYLDMGTPRSRVSNLSSPTPTVGTITYGNISAQQIRIGLRYMID